MFHVARELRAGFSTLASEGKRSRFARDSAHSHWKRVVGGKDGVGVGECAGLSLYLLNVVRVEKQFYLLGVARPASGLSVFTSNCNARLRSVDFGR